MARQATTFGDLLRRLRTEAGVTQEELAERAGLSRRGISDLERGVNRWPYRATVRQLIDALGLEDLQAIELQALAARRKGPAAMARRTMVRAPIPPTPILGREREVEMVRHLLEREGRRLVTLTGTGGVGKTRLALEVARQVAGEYADGVVFVSLAAIADPALVPSTVAAELGVTPNANASVEEALGRFLAERELFLVLDNFEHLLPAAELVARLLAGSPQLKFLVTSRQPLQLHGEQQITLEPLVVPPPGYVPPLHDLAPFPAVALFLQRAREVLPELDLSAGDLAAVVEICRRLDGLPLAIELATGRIKLLPPQALLERLASRLTLLTGGTRDGPMRQHTLRHTLDWSYDLLNAGERELFARLGVFAGGFTIEAGEAVCDAELDTLASLVDKNLIRRDGERLAMLETIWEFALEKLVESGEAGEIRRRHAEYFLALAQSANLTIEAEGEQRHDLIVHDRDNLRGALEWALQSGEVELGLQLAVALENYWAANSPLEGRRWLGELLARSGELPGDLRARALRACGGSAWIVGEFEEGTRQYEASLAEYRRLGDERGVAVLLHRLAVEALRRGETERARALQDESLRLHRKFKSKKGEAQALYVFAELELRSGNDELAFELSERSASLAGEIGFAWWRTRVLLNLAKRLLERGHMPESAARVREALPLVTQMGDRQQTIYALALLARLAADTGQPERAGRLWGAIEAEEARAPVGQWEAERDAYAERVLAHAGPEFERGRQEGARLSLNEAVDEAIDAVR